jgi:serine/threonine protein kinase
MARCPICKRHYGSPTGRCSVDGAPLEPDEQRGEAGGVTDSVGEQAAELIDPQAETLALQSGAEEPGGEQERRGVDPAAATMASSPGDKVDDEAKERGVGRRLEPGSKVGDYEITGWLGAGGMGEVYAGLHPVIDKKVAIKLLFSELGDQPELVRRFGVEARAASRIKHPNIVDVLGFGELPDGSRYIVMEHLRGKTLGEEMAAHQPMSYDRALPILRGLCEGLSAAHAADVIHRDLKPANVFLVDGRTGPARVKLLDFGVARLFEDGLSVGKTRTGVKLGTPLYMAPEQGEGKHVDHRADLYSLGVILFQMFAGAPPFSARSYLEILQAHCFEPPPAPSEWASLDPGLEELILWALAKSPKDRPPTVEALSEKLLGRLEELVAAGQERPALRSRGRQGARRPERGSERGSERGGPKGERAPSAAPSGGRGFVRSASASGTPRYDLSTRKAPPTPPRKRRSPRWILVGAVMAAAVAAGGGLAYHLAAKRSAGHGSGGRDAAEVERTGTLSVITRPEGAVVWIGDERVPQKTPALISNLPLGRKLRVRVELDGHRPKVKHVTLSRRSKARQVRFELKGVAPRKD